MAQPRASFLVPGVRHEPLDGDLSLHDPIAGLDDFTHPATAEQLQFKVDRLLKDNELILSNAQPALLESFKRLKDQVTK